mgnify:FL=1
MPKCSVAFLLKHLSVLNSSAWQLARAKVTTERCYDPFLFVVSMFRVLRCYCVGITSPEKDGRLQEISNF